MLTRVALARPVTTFMVCLIVVILGGISLRGLSVDLMPDVEFPTVTVTTLYPGAGPEELETLVTRPLEQVLSGVTGFERLSSRTLEGSCSIRVQFEWGTNLDAAVADMRQAIDRIRNDLPEGVEPPVMRQYDANASPIIYLGLNGSLPPTEVTRIAERTILPRLERLDGVARVGMRGQIQREIQVQIDRDRLQTLGMGINEVITALQEENVTGPAGHVRAGDLNVLLRNRGEFRDLDQIRRTVIRRSGDAVVRVQDVADVIDGVQELTEMTRLNGEPGIMVYVYQQSGANTIDVSDEVQKAVVALNRELGGNLRLAIRLDKADFIRSSIENIRSAAIAGMALAMIILLLFLGSFRSTLMIGISMPLSILATFILIYFQGFTLNLVSFGGLALGMGMLVDNSIVVLESIFRKRDDGLPPSQAALKGTREVGSAITASTLTTLVVFLPLLFTTGVASILLHQLAYVVSASLVSSLIVSLTLTPVLAAFLLKERAPAAEGRRSRWGRIAAVPVAVTRLVAASGRWILAPMERGYSASLRPALRHPGWAMFPILLIASGTLGLIPLVGTDFLPQTDDGRLGITGTMAPGIHLETLDRQTRKIESVLDEKLPEAESVSVFIGDEASDGDDWNTTRFIVQLKPRDERSESAEEIRQRILKDVGPVAGMKLRARVYNPLPMSRMFGSNEGDNLQVLIRGYNRRTAQELSTVVMREMESVPGITNIEQQMKDERPEVSIRIDPDKAALLGLRVQHVADALEATIRGIPATIFREDGDEFDVLVRLREEDRSGLASIGEVNLATGDGRLIPLKNVASIRGDQSPLAIDRLDRQRVIVISASVSDRNLGATVADLQARLEAIPTPNDFTLEIGGDYEEQEKSFQMLLGGLVLAILLMYMIMASQFESLKEPLLILVALPLAGIGVLLTLVYWDTTLNVQSFIGLIVLAGIVVNNAIVLVDYANQLRDEEPDVPLVSLIRRACVRRFRPIIMTTLTTVLGMLPVALGLGEGGELQAPLARVVIGGLLSGTVMTLYVIPILLRLTLNGSSDAEEAEKAGVAAPVAAPVG